jgi:hypothetical protein
MKKYGGSSGKAFIRHLIINSNNKPMNHLKKLPGYSRSPSGFEWVLFKKLPIIFILGSAIPGITMLSIFLKNPTLSPEQQKIIYQCLGFLFSYWFLVGVAAFGCILVMLMKGPAYVADPYDLPKENKQFENHRLL